MEKNTGKKVVTQGKHREFYLGWNVATLFNVGLFWVSDLSRHSKGGSFPVEENWTVGLSTSTTWFFWINTSR